MTERVNGKECDFPMSLWIHYTNPGLPTSRPLLYVRKINLFESLLFYFADVTGLHVHPPTQHAHAPEYCELATADREEYPQPELLSPEDCLAALWGWATLQKGGEQGESSASTSPQASPETNMNTEELSLGVSDPLRALPVFPRVLQLLERNLTSQVVACEYLLIKESPRQREGPTCLFPNTSQGFQLRHLPWICPLQKGTGQESQGQGWLGRSCGCYFR